jgi:hypothetical protein
MSKTPDNISENPGLLPYGSNIGAPAIKPDNISDWKFRSVDKVNKQLSAKFNELKEEYIKLVKEFEWNELVYSSKFAYEPIIGEIYHLYVGKTGEPFLSLISPTEWNREHLGSFKLTSDHKWIKI